jgi:signal transduction histidine kinase
MADIQLDTEVLDALHPFTLIFDCNMSVCHCGPDVILDEHTLGNFKNQATITAAHQIVPFVYDQLLAMKSVFIGISMQTEKGEYHINGRLFPINNGNQLLFVGEDALRKVTAPAATIPLSEPVEPAAIANFYKEIVDNMPADIAVFSTDFRFLYINKRAIKDDEFRNWLIGKTDADFWKARNKPLDKAAKRIEGLKTAIAERRPSIVEETLNAGTADEKIFLRIITPGFSGGEITYLATYGIEITELRKSQHILKEKNEELQQLNEELDQFVYSASHNLRAPLMSILGMANLIDPDTTPAELTLLSRGIQKSVQLLDETIRDIIEYSHNSRVPMLPRQVNLTTLIKGEFERLHFFFKGKVSLAITSGPDELLTDKKRLAFVIRNILSNSYKYADELKEKQWIHVTISNNGTETEIKISDNGIGITAERLPRVFEMFYRGTIKSTGAGLGLFVSRQIILKLKGNIHISSAPGTGTTVTITLPPLPLV